MNWKNILTLTAIIVLLAVVIVMIVQIVNKAEENSGKPKPVKIEIGK